LCRRRIELGWVPLAGVAMTVFTLAIAWLDADTPWFLVVLGCAAFAAAVFLVPLNAYLQDIVDPAQRGRILAAMNLQDCFAGVVAVVLQFGFTAVHGALGRPVWLGPRGQVVFAAVLSAVVTWRVARRLPSDMIRVIGLPVVRWWYRTRALHAGRVPGRGGVLLLVNHLTFADAFVVTALCPRPVRFVMAAEFERNRWVRGFTRLFNTVPLDGSRPREAIRAAVAALEAGDIVCVFPEGQLSRLGVMNELRRGFELIARHGGCPVIPLYVDGMWGSFFSSEGGGFFRRHRCRRLPVIGAFGEVLDPGAATAAAVRHGLRAAAADCLAERVTAAGLDMLGGADGGAAEARRWLANGCQVWATAAAPRAEGFYAWADDPEATALHGLVRVLPRWFGVPVHWLGPDEQPAAGRRVLGGTVARERLVAAGTPVAFDDFSAVIVPLPAGIEHFPALAVDGIVVAMSMPDPPRPLAGSLQQLGVRAGCRGRLLPGFVLVAGGGGELRLGGPACPPAGLALPAGSRLDDLGFVQIGGVQPELAEGATI
jgi:acyl-[acyl-carrier-protein]-phospholipid O-acyltransferase/long-chain-fatty-acid--[acyl-carrier-protein] ligase